MDVQKYKHDLLLNGFTHVHGVFQNNEITEVTVILDGLFQRQMDNNLPLGTSKVRANIHEINHTIKLDKALKKTPVFKKCQALASVFLGKHAKVSFDHAIYKKPQSESVKWHQDQAYKNTVKKMTSLHFWIPLQDTPVALGCMQYVKAKQSSHLFLHKKENNGQTLSLDINNFVDVDVDVDEDEISVCESLKGDLQIHSPNTIHGSLPNQTNEIRKAWIIHFSPYGYWEPLLPHNLLHNAYNRLFS
jgi:ectoine hydroxylase-related dioxygenase (phytanoyl-CoA dioxygenase family)